MNSYSFLFFMKFLLDRHQYAPINIEWSIPAKKGAYKVANTRQKSEIREDLRINVSFKSLDVDEVELYDWIKKKSKGIGPSGFIKMHMFKLMSESE